MAVRIGASMSGSVKDFTDGVLKAGGLAVEAAVSAAGDNLKEVFRADVAAAALGTRLGNAIGSKFYANNGLDAAAIVFPRGTKAENIFRAWNEGATIVAHNGKEFLAFPTKDAGRGSTGRTALTPVAFTASTGIKLTFIPSKGGKAAGFLIGTAVSGKNGRGFRQATKGRAAQGRQRQSKIFFVLVDSTTVQARLHFKLLAQAEADKIPALIEREAT